MSQVAGAKVNSERHAPRQRKSEMGATATAQPPYYSDAQGVLAACDGLLSTDLLSTDLLSAGLAGASLITWTPVG